MFITASQQNLLVFRHSLLSVDILQLIRVHVLGLRNTQVWDDDGEEADSSREQEWSTNTKQLQHHRKQFDGEEESDGPDDRGDGGRGTTHWHRKQFREQDPRDWSQTQSIAKTDENTGQDWYETEIIFFIIIISGWSQESYSSRQVSKGQDSQWQHQQESSRCSEMKNHDIVWFAINMYKPWCC